MINPRRLSPAKINRIQQLYKADYNYAEIARICDVGYKAVHYYCTRIKPHPRHRPPAELKWRIKYNQTIQARNLRGNHGDHCPTATASADRAH